MARDTQDSNSHLDHLLTPNLEEPWFKSALKNIAEVFNPPKLPPLELTSRPIEDTTGLYSGSLDEPWYKSILRNIGELLNPPKLPPLQLTSRPIESAGPQVEEPWIKTFFHTIRDTINPPKLPPLELTSKPIDVKPMWGAYENHQSRYTLVSMICILGFVALMTALLATKVIPKKPLDATVIFAPVNLKPYTPPPAKQIAGGGGGGGDKAPKPVSKGDAPKFAPKQFIAPTPAIPKPELPVAPTITAEAPHINADQYGDPLSKNLAFSPGQGTNGLGNGSGHGIGNGNGDGYGPGNGHGTGGGAYRIGGGVSAPSIISKMEPEYSEEARKAKFQGTVVLQIVVDEHGLPRDLRVIRPLGLGLDEKAIEAVQKWRFRPGTKDGHAVATQATVEVNFRLL